MTPTELMRDIANPSYKLAPRAGRFLMLVARCGSRAAAIRFAARWVRQHKGYGRWGLRTAIQTTRPREAPHA